MPSTNDVDLDANDFTIVHDDVVAVDIIGDDTIANKIMQLRVSAAMYNLKQGSPASGYNLTKVYPIGYEQVMP